MPSLKFEHISDRLVASERGQSKEKLKLLHDLGLDCYLFLSMMDE